MGKRIFILATLFVCGGWLQANAQTSSSDYALKRAISLYNFDHWTEARACVPNYLRLRIERELSRLTTIWPCAIRNLN